MTPFTMQIYRGDKKSMELNPQDLDMGADYMCRVCAIRVCDDRTQLIGPYSVPFTFHIPASISDDFISSKNHSSNSSKSLSTTAQVKSTFFQVNIMESFKGISRYPFLL